jgi:hypothetical protein
MSDASRFTDHMTSRPLRDEERELIRALLPGDVANQRSGEEFADARVIDMKDGGMGSIRFVQPGPQKFGKTLAEAHYVDSDGVLVTITANVDQSGRLFEIDFWKVDFSPLKHYPKREELAVER